MLNFVGNIARLKSIVLQEGRCWEMSQEAFFRTIAKEL